MALTGKQFLSLTPEQIAEMMTDDISVNNGLRSSHKPQRPWEPPPTRYRHRETQTLNEFSNRGYMAEQIKAMRAELARSVYGSEIPTRVSILPRSSYKLPAKKVIAEHKEQPKITSSLGKRKIKL